MAGLSELNSACSALQKSALGTKVNTIVTLVNDIRTKLVAFISGGMVTSGALAIGSTPANISTLDFLYTIAGVMYQKAAVAAGTATGAHTIPQNKYGALALDIGVDGVIHATACTNIATGFDTAVAAIADLPAVAASHVRIGYITAVKTGSAFVLGTDSLIVATSTVVYVSNAGVLASLGAAVTALTD